MCHMLRCLKESGHNFKFPAFNPNPSFNSLHNIVVGNKILSRVWKGYKMVLLTIAIQVHAYSLSTPFHIHAIFLIFGRNHMRSKIWESVPIQDNWRSNLGIIWGPGSFAVHLAFLLLNDRTINKGPLSSVLRHPNEWSIRKPPLIFEDRRQAFWKCLITHGLWLNSHI